MTDKKGQRTIAGLLYFFMAIVIAALFLDPVKESIQIGKDSIGNFTNGVLITMLITYWPVYLVIMALIILVIIVK